MKIEFYPLSEQQRQSQQALMTYLLEVYEITQAEPQVRHVSAQLDALAEKARTAIDQTQDLQAQIQQLMQLVYQDWAFVCDEDPYHFPADCLLIDKLLEKKLGADLSLGALVLFLAERLNLPLFPVNFSTQLLLRADIEGKMLLINPVDGQTVQQEVLNQWIADYIGFYKLPEIYDISPADDKALETLKAHLAQHLKNGLIREERTDEALRYINERLKLNPKNPYEIRDRGLVMATLGCTKEAVADFRFFVQRCPTDPMADLLRDQIMGGLDVNYSVH
ncbi:SirB1 family protein [Testudinibacter sp. P80/BLE/0925]|uniref:SirB1 family protein n=1 Tax=Testudinibacter sp. TW-1 TaxID=3417757 RepID=UPI003D35A22A